MSKKIKIGLVLLLVLLAIAWMASIQFEPIKSNETSNSETRKSAPNFKLYSIEGDSISLSEFKGKLIYIKFWASWCGDCIKQVVPQRRIEKELASRSDIVFVNVSVDDDLDAWRKSVTRNKLIGHELISRDGDDADINENYDIDEIPRYILIDKKGDIIDANAPKPSEIDADYFLNFLK